MALTYERCRELLSSARSKDNGKPLANNTRLLKRNDDYHVVLHSTSVVIVHPDDSCTLHTGGWFSNTTKDRINTYSPASVYVKNGVWIVGQPGGGQKRFVDGMTVGSGGLPFEELPKPNFAIKRKLDKLISNYISGFIEHISEGELEPPSSGDCWGCVFQEKGENWKSKPFHEQHVMGLDHLFSHFHDEYYVPSLLFRALGHQGLNYPDPGITYSLLLPDNFGPRGCIYLHCAERGLRSFFRKLKPALMDMVLEDPQLLEPSLERGEVHDR